MKKAGEKGKKVTLEKLANMVANGFSEVERRLETLGATTDAVKEDTDKNFLKVRNDLLGLDDTFIPRHEFEARMKMVGNQFNRQGERISHLSNRR